MCQLVWSRDSRCAVMAAPEEYLEREVLKLSSGIGHLGDIQLGLALAVLGTWIVVCATLSKGIKSSGKVRTRRQRERCHENKKQPFKVFV